MSKLIKTFVKKHYVNSMHAEFALRPPTRLSVDIAKLSRRLWVLEIETEIDSVSK